MNAKLKEIQTAITEVKKDLASLKLDSLDDIDAITAQRIALKEKLAVLEDAETVEQDRLADEAAADRIEKRRELLMAMADRSDKLVAQYEKRTETVIALVDNLVDALAKRESVFCRESVGLNTSDAINLFSLEEKDALMSVLDRSTVGIYSGSFYHTWHEAVTQRCQDNAQLKQVLYDLVKHTAGMRAPITNARPLFAETARKLADSAPMTASKPEVKVVHEKPTGARYVADLRDNSKVINLNNER